MWSPTSLPPQVCRPTPSGPNYPVMVKTTKCTWRQLSNSQDWFHHFCNLIFGRKIGDYWKVATSGIASSFFKLAPPRKPSWTGQLVTHKAPSGCRPHHPPLYPTSSLAATWCVKGKNRLWDKQTQLQIHTNPHLQEWNWTLPTWALISVSVKWDKHLPHRVGPKIKWNMHANHLAHELE